MVTNIILFIIGIYLLGVSFAMDTTGWIYFVMFKMFPALSGLFLLAYSAKLFGWL